MHEGINKYSQTEVGSTYINGQRITTIFDSCSSVTIIKHNVIAESDVVKIRIKNIEERSYKMVWKKLKKYGIDLSMIMRCTGVNICPKNPIPFPSGLKLFPNTK